MPRPQVIQTPTRSQQGHGVAVGRQQDGGLLEVLAGPRDAGVGDAQAVQLRRGGAEVLRAVVQGVVVGQGDGVEDAVQGLEVA
jgi:hypothetical protein